MFFFDQFAPFQWTYYDQTLQIASISAGVCFFIYFISHYIFNHLLFTKTYQKLSNAGKKEWNERTLSTIHAIISTGLVFYCYYKTWPLPWTNLFDHHEYLYVFTLSLSAGYMLADFFLTIYVGDEQSGLFLALLHHTIGFIAFAEASVAAGSQCIVLFYVATEASTPFVNLRWMLHEAGLKDHSVYLFNGLAMMLVFFLIRILPLPFIYYQFYNQLNQLMAQSFPVIFSTFFLTTLINTLNLFWFNKMIQGALKAFGGKKNN